MFTVSFPTAFFPSPAFLVVTWYVAVDLSLQSTLCVVTFIGKVDSNGFPSCVDASSVSSMGSPGLIVALLIPEEIRFRLYALRLGASVALPFCARPVAASFTVASTTSSGAVEPQPQPKSMFASETSKVNRADPSAMGCAVFSAMSRYSAPDEPPPPPRGSFLATMPPPNPISPPPSRCHTITSYVPDMSSPYVYFALTSPSIFACPRNTAVESGSISTSNAGRTYRSSVNDPDPETVPDPGTVPSPSPFAALASTVYLPSGGSVLVGILAVTTPFASASSSRRNTMNSLGSFTVSVTVADLGLSDADVSDNTRSCTV